MNLRLTLLACVTLGTFIAGVRVAEPMAPPRHVLHAVASPLQCVQA